MAAPTITERPNGTPRPGAKERHPMKAQIPVIDLSSALTGDPVSRLRTGKEIDRTCTEIGFFTITGHGVPGEVIRGLNSKAHEFFALPMVEKFEVMPADIKHPR